MFVSHTFTHIRIQLMVDNYYYYDFWQTSLLHIYLLTLAEPSMTSRWQFLAGACSASRRSGSEPGLWILDSDLLSSLPGSEWDILSFAHVTVFATTDKISFAFQTENQAMHLWAYFRPTTRSIVANDEQITHSVAYLYVRHNRTLILQVEKKWKITP